MSTYINTDTNEYPLYEGDIRLLYPNIGNDFVLPNGFAEVPDSNLPEITETQVAEETTPKLNANGIYEKVYIIRELTQEEINAKAIMRESIYFKPEPNPDAALQPGL